MLPYQAGEEEADSGCAPSKVQAVQAHGRWPAGCKPWMSNSLGVFALHALPGARTNTPAELFPQHTHGVMCWHSCSLGGTTVFFHTGRGDTLGQWAKKYSLKRTRRKCWQLHISLDITVLAEDGGQSAFTIKEFMTTENWQRAADSCPQQSLYQKC